MAKKDKAKRTKKEADPNSITRVSLRDVLKSEGAMKVYGVAKKLVNKETLVGVAQGLKGTFEVVNGDGKVTKTKAAFLGDTVQETIVKLLTANPKEPIMFGVELVKAGDNAVDSTFFHEPSITDPLASLREAATE